MKEEGLVEGQLAKGGSSQGCFLFFWPVFNFFRLVGVFPTHRIRGNQYCSQVVKKSVKIGGKKRRETELRVASSPRPPVLLVFCFELADPRGQEEKEPSHLLTITPVRSRPYASRSAVALWSRPVDFSLKRPGKQKIAVYEFQLYVISCSTF